MDSDRPNAERTVLAVLGASNVWLALPEIVEHLASRFHSSKLDLHTAHGPGRSYGNVAGMLGWKYPSLRSCGVFEALERAAETDTPTRRCALVTDIGNDIGYGAKSDEILDWVEECIEALRASETAISVTSLPVESVTDLAPWKFGLSRRILFPFRNLTYADCRARIEEIESSLSRDADALAIARRAWRDQHVVAQASDSALLQGLAHGSRCPTTFTYPSSSPGGPDVPGHELSRYGLQP